MLSDDYKAQLQYKHATEDWGGSGGSHVPLFVEHLASTGSRSILDYGCGKGKGTLKKRMAQLEMTTSVAEYDPGIIGKTDLPEPADYLVCTDVIEHIEPERLDTTLAHIFSLARKGMYLNISCVPARGLLPDGRNAHLIIWPGEIWLAKLKEFPGWTVVNSADLGKKIRVWLEPTRG